MLPPTQATRLWDAYFKRPVAPDRMPTHAGPLGQVEEWIEITELAFIGGFARKTAQRVHESSSRGAAGESLPEKLAMNHPHLACPLPVAAEIDGEGPILVQGAESADPVSGAIEQDPEFWFSNHLLPCLQLCGSEEAYV